MICLLRCFLSLCSKLFCFILNPTVCSLFFLFSIPFFNVLCTENTSACCKGILCYLFVYEVHCTHTRWEHMRINNGKSPAARNNSTWKTLQNATALFGCLLGLHLMCVWWMCMLIFVSVCVFWYQVASFLSLVNLLKSLIPRSGLLCAICVLSC